MFYTKSIRYGTYCLFSAGLCLVIFSSYTVFHFHKGSINGKHKDDVLVESNIAFGSIIVAGSILYLLSIPFSCYMSWDYTLGRIMEYALKITVGKIITLKACVIMFCIALKLELMGLMFAFLASSHIERSEDDENSTFDGANMCALGVFVAVIIPLETYLVCYYM